MGRFGQTPRRCRWITTNRCCCRTLILFPRRLTNEHFLSGRQNLFAGPRQPGRKTGVRGRNVHYWTPTAQIRTCGFPAYGSCLRCLTAKRRMLSYSSGMIGLPLRLLAREVYNRAVEKAGTAAVALITGEEKIKPESPQTHMRLVA